MANNLQVAGEDGPKRLTFFVRAKESKQRNPICSPSENK